MSLLNFKESGPKNSGRQKKLKFTLGVGTLVGVIALGSTLAASINLNSGSPVEFGQGVAQAIACDSNILVTPISSFLNSEENSGFKFSSIILSQLDGTSQDSQGDEGCASRSFRIKSYDASGTLLEPTFSISINGDGQFSSPDGMTDGSNEGDSDSSVQLYFSDSSINAEAVYRITIESLVPEFVPEDWTPDVWTSSTENGPTVYANQLTSGKPSWLTENSLHIGEFNYSFSTAGMGMTGDSEGFPYVTNFSIPADQKVTVRFAFNYNADCSDHGVILTPESNSNPDWSWGSNPDGLIAQWNCGNDEIGWADNVSFGGVELTIGDAYIGEISFDPTLLSGDNFILTTKTLDGTVIGTLSTVASIPGNTAYRIGFSADQDREGQFYSYYKNLIITLG